MPMKKILLAVVALGAAAVSIVGLSAFEAHVINVTAKIENALNVPIASIDFGTVFPQEKLDKFFDVSLSQSFQDEDRVDDVTYIIRQKPKCQLVVTNSTDLPEFGVVTENTDGTFRCLDEEHYNMLPLLCPYLSKHEVTDDGQGATGGPLENDSAGIAAFHGLPGDWTMATTLATEVAGKLIKSAGDILDTWNIDLKVPCFGNHCAQDWAQFVADNDGDNNADPIAYIQPLENESKLFGCDLWLEVMGISLPGFGCQGKIDLMLVVDESGSIGPTNMALVRTALHSFIDALVLATDGPNAGQTSFAYIGVLDQELTSSPAAMHAAIDTLFSGGLTNLSGGIALANDEFNSVRDRADAPNIMLVVTDGYPNVCHTIDCNGGTPATEAAGYSAAGIADGTEIFVVGVGTGVNATYLTNDIASDAPPTHYFAGDFDTLEDTVLDLISCPA